MANLKLDLMLVISTGCSEATDILVDGDAQWRAVFSEETTVRVAMRAAALKTLQYFLRANQDGITAPHAFRILTALEELETDVESSEA